MDFLIKNLMTVLILASPFILWTLYKLIILPLIDWIDKILGKLSSDKSDLDKKNEERKKRMEEIRKHSKKD